MKSVFFKKAQKVCAALSLLGLTISMTTGVAWSQDLAAQMNLGKKLFTTATPAACSVCHTLKDAGSEGAIGPVFDELQPDAARVRKALQNGLGNMPAFKDTLNTEQMEALAVYVSRASRGQK